MGIRIDCYLAKLKEFKRKYPYAHFEVITNTSKSNLAPSKELLIDAGIFNKPNGTKNPKMDFEEFKIRFMGGNLFKSKCLFKTIRFKKSSKRENRFSCLLL